MHIINIKWCTCKLVFVITLLELYSFKNAALVFCGIQSILNYPNDVK